jgi:hypothetical protein
MYYEPQFSFIEFRKPQISGHLNALSRRVIFMPHLSTLALSQPSALFPNPLHGGALLHNADNLFQPHTASNQRLRAAQKAFFSRRTVIFTFPLSVARTVMIKHFAHHICV